MGNFTKLAFMVDSVASRGLAGAADNLAMFNLAGEAEKLILVSVHFRDGKKSLLEINGEIYKAIVTLCFGIKNENSTAPTSNIPKEANVKSILSQPKINTPDEIRKFKALFDDGIITQDEFDIKKKQLLELQPSQSFSEVTNATELDVLSNNDEQSLSTDDKIKQRLDLVNTIFHSTNEALETSPPSFSEDAKVAELEVHNANDERPLTNVNEMKHKINEIVNTEAKVSSLSIYENIPEKKLKKALSSYAKLSSVDESVVLFYDANFLLSNCGFILTTKNLYFKDLKGEGRLQIADIINITFEPNAKPEASLFVKTISNRYQIGIWHLDGNKGDDALRIIDKTIAVLTNR